ncbi:MAG: type IV pilus assembly protein PilM [Legionellaceae bacterium]|nr:type IV pilus assembly protein PilM [Legionellaceae bacterium]
MWHLFRLLRSQANTTLGIDISTTSVKLIELSCVGEHYRVENYGRHIALDHTIQDGDANPVDVMSQCLRELLKNTVLSHKEAVLSIPDSYTISKTIQVSDRLEDDDLEELVLIEVDKHIPHPINEINFDFKVLGPSVGQVGMRDVLIVACRAEHINDRVDALRLVGLRTKCVDIESHAIQRALRCMVPKGNEKTIVLLDVDDARIKMFVFHEMDIIFVHGDFLKSHHEPLLQFKMQLLSHVKRALQFFYSSHPLIIIDDILLAGSVAKPFDLAEFLQTELRISTCVANPLATMLFAKHVPRDVVVSDAPMLMTVCGLAIRA